MTLLKKLHYLLICFLLCGCSLSAQSPERQLIDEQATKKTRTLYQNLFRIADQGFMFGHEDTDAYGIGWWAEKGKSDVKAVTGTYPAIHGWDLGNIGREFNIDTVNFKDMHRWIRETYKRGGINTVSWHMVNLVSDGPSWDTTAAVKALLPGGSHHEEFLEKLDKVARFFKKCRYWFTKIPIIFRPFHEHNGDWFWWGKGNASEEDYIALYRFTVDYLQNEKDIHHLIYAFSPDRSRMDTDSARQSYFYGYPGDDYVDIIGLDNYWDVGHPANQADNSALQREQFVKSLQLITDIAHEKGKVAALTETGYFGIENPHWFTEVILEPIKENKETIDIAYLLVWRNRFKESSMVPFPGHHAAEDFREFEKDPYTIFEDDLYKVYKAYAPLGME